MERTPNADFHAAWLVSLVSVVWTVAASTIALVIAVLAGSAVLGAFGGIGFVDATGSVALVYHFHHAKRHDLLAEHLERIAHRIVVTGLFLVGAGAVVVGTIRVVTGATGDDSFAGLVLAGVSLAVLSALSARKQTIALRVGSPALRADGRLSAVGAAQAGVALLGTAARGFGWSSADAIAAIVVGLVAMTTAFVTRRGA